jgi:hypothetical protein
MALESESQRMALALQKAASGRGTDHECHHRPENIQQLAGVVLADCDATVSFLCFRESLSNAI